MSFNIGDEVCCSKVFDNLILGRKYKILEIDKSHLTVSDCITNKKVGKFFKSCFIKVIPSSHTTYVLIEKDKLAFVTINGKECLFIPEELKHKLIYKGDYL